MCQVMLSVARGVNSSTLSISCKDTLYILMQVNHAIHSSIALKGTYPLFRNQDHLLKSLKQLTVHYLHVYLHPTNTYLSCLSWTYFDRVECIAVDFSHVGHSTYLMCILVLLWQEETLFMNEVIDLASNVCAINLDVLLFR